MLLLGLALAGAAACSPSAAPGERLTILLPDDVMSLDPNKDVETFTDAVLFNVFEPLVSFDAELQVRPGLAVSWEHPCPECWRFHLRPGVRFHDGTPLTAEHVRDALASLRASETLEAGDFLSEVKSIEAIDGSTVDLVTHRPRALLANLPVVYVTKANAGGSFPPLVGTGPYRLREWKKGDRVVLERQNYYWGAPPTFREVVFLPELDAQARLERLERGEADIAYDVPPEAARTPRQGVRFVRHPGLTLYYVTFDLSPRKDNPFTELRVRQAVHLAIDREAIVERFLAGSGSVPSQPVPSAAFGYDPSLPSPVHDPARARKLLAEAGHPQGFVTSLVVSPANRRAGELIRDDLAAIGIQLELRVVERQAAYELAKVGATEMFLAGWSFSSGEASEFYEFCLHTRSERMGFSNYGRYSNPRIDAIARENAEVLDPRARQRLLQEAAAIAMQDLPVLPLLLADDVYAVRDEVTFLPRADSEIRLLDVRHGR